MCVLCIDVAVGQSTLDAAAATAAVDISYMYGGMKTISSSADTICIDALSPIV